MLSLFSTRRQDSDLPFDEWSSAILLLLKILFFDFFWHDNTPFCSSTHTELIDLSEDNQQSDSSSESDASDAQASSAKRSKTTETISCFSRPSVVEADPRNDMLTNEMHILRCQKKPQLLDVLVRMMQHVKNEHDLICRISSAVLSGTQQPSQDDLIAFLIDIKHSYDTIFVLGDQQQDYLLAHREVLLQHEYFRNMLDDGSTWAEYRDGRKPFVIQKPNISKDVFYHLLQYVYCGGFDGLTHDNVLPLMRAASELELADLFRLCFYALLQHVVTTETACKIFEQLHNMNYARFYSDGLAGIYCMLMVQDHDVFGLNDNTVTDTTITREDISPMLQLSQGSLAKILFHMQCIDLSHYETLLLVVEWATRKLGLPSCSNLRFDGLTADQRSDLRVMLEPLLIYAGTKELGEDVICKVIEGLGLQNTAVETRWLRTLAWREKTFSRSQSMLFLTDFTQQCTRTRSSFHFQQLGSPPHRLCSSIMGIGFTLEMMNVDSLWKAKLSLNHTEKEFDQIGCILVSFTFYVFCTNTKRIALRKATTKFEKYDDNYEFDLFDSRF